MVIARCGDFAVFWVGGAVGPPQIPQIHAVLSSPALHRDRAVPRRLLAHLIRSGFTTSQALTSLRSTSIHLEELAITCPIGSPTAI